MGKIENTFSWSFSAAADFEACQRKRYWSKYGKWGGWDRDASPIQKKAYQLDKMDNFYSLLGQAVERAAMHILRRHQMGERCDVPTAYAEVAKPFLNTAWKESRNGRWRENPKKFTCLREHYYNTLSQSAEKEMTQEMVKRTMRCLENFTQKTLPRLSDVTRDMELPIQSPERPGDPEHFLYEGVKIYAIPDYAYRKEGVIHIHDWKAGKQKNTHKEQLALYGLWADVKHRKQNEDICVYVEYLKDGEVATYLIKKEDLERVAARIDQSVADMTELLQDADRSLNQPLPKENWELALDPSICEYCNFFEICEPELRELNLI